MLWVDPSITLRWGPYSRPDGQEQGAIVKLTCDAKTAGLITTRMAIEKLSESGVFEIDNVDAALKAIEEERAENDQREAAKMALQAENDAKALHAAAKVTRAGRQPGATGKPGGSKAPASD